MTADDDSPEPRPGTEAKPRPAAAFARVVGETVDRDATVVVRPYDPDLAGDTRALWSCKRAFERELGGGDAKDGADRDEGQRERDRRDERTTSDMADPDDAAPSKAAAYEAKLTADYRERYLAWVERCVAEEPVVWLAVDGETETDGGVPPTGDTATATPSSTLGYVFVLPESLSMVWDGAVLNELYVRPAARGEGLADALLGAAVVRAGAQSLPMDRLLLDVAPGNERAQGFYDRHGFESWGEMVVRDL